MKTIQNIKNELGGRVPPVVSKVSQVLASANSPTPNAYNPYLGKNGQLVNPYIDYQRLMDSPVVSDNAKKYISGATGIVPATTPAVSKAPAAQATQNFQPTSTSIADAAKKYIGTPYVWGGESMSEGGMDCSGFVYNALKDAGVDVGRTTAQGYRNYGTTVSKAEMQPGDLIFYGKGGKASHVGVYIGNGQMVHSAGGSKNTKSNPGKGVSIASVDHRKDFIEVRRY